MEHISLNNVTKDYVVGSQRLSAVKDASLIIEKGDFLTIVGHSGSGKTTLLSLIGGVTNPSSGSIIFDGLDISAFSSDDLSRYRSNQVGFMFQFASLFPMLTVRENLLLPTAFCERSDVRKNASQKAPELLRLVGIADKIDHFPAQLSGGQQRRVAIARAFMNEPSVILADEPTGDLDEETESDMMDFFKSMNRDRRITFIMVTHNTDLAKQAMRQIRMQSGMIVQQ